MPSFEHGYRRAISEIATGVFCGVFLKCFGIHGVNSISLYFPNQVVKPRSSCLSSVGYALLGELVIYLVGFLEHSLCWSQDWLEFWTSSFISLSLLQFC